jgi:hypothetical protein
VSLQAQAAGARAGAKKFERLVNAAREAGLLAKDATQLLDSSHVLGAAGARDTYTLIRVGIRKLLTALGYKVASKGQVTDRLWWYLDLQSPETPDIAWSDAEVRAVHLNNNFEDVEEALSLVNHAGASPAVNEASALLEKIGRDDVEQGTPQPLGPKRRGRPPKDKQPQDAEKATQQPPAEHSSPTLRQSVPKDRVLRIVDPKMRVGHNDLSTDT